MSAPRPLPGEELASCDGERLLGVWEENGCYREREMARPFPYTDHASLFDLTGVRVHRWTLADGTVVTSRTGGWSLSTGKSRRPSGLTGHHLVIPNSAVLYMAD